MSRRFAAAALLALAACAPARQESGPEIPEETFVPEPFEPRWWIEVVPGDGTLELLFPPDSSFMPAPVPAERRVDVRVGALPPGLRDRIAAHRGEPLVAFVAVEPGTALRDVLQTLTLMHEAGIRRFDPASLLGALPARSDRE